MTYEAQIGRVIPLGRVGENEITEVTFDYSCWIDAYGEGEFRLVHRRNCDSAALPIEIAAEGGRITWTLTEADTAAQGEGEAQLTYYASSGKIKKSAIYKTMTTRSLTSGENTPQPYRGFVDTVLAAAQTAETAAAAAQAAQTGAEAAAQDAAQAAHGSAQIVQDEMDILHGLVNYGFDEHQTLEADPESDRDFMHFGADRLWMRTVISSSGAAPYVVRIKISGNLDRSGSNATTDRWTTGITLPEGHAYRATMTQVSGTVTTPEGIDPPALSIYTVGTHSSVGSGVRASDKVYYRDYTVPEGGAEINLVIYIYAGTVLNNAAYIVTLEDITERLDAHSLREDVDRISMSYPETSACARRTARFVSLNKIPAAAVYGTLPRQNGQAGVTEYYDKGEEIPAIIYSSVWREGRDVYRNITTEAYYSMMANPASELYTKNSTDLGIHNAHAYYGGVCSSFVSWACGFREYWTSSAMNSFLEDKVMDSLEALEVGDILWKSGHVSMISQVLTDGDGRVRYVDVSEMDTPMFRTTRRPIDAFRDWFIRNGYKVKANPNGTRINPVTDPDFNGNVIFERGNNTYLTLQEILDEGFGGAWFYIPNHDTVYARKNGWDWKEIALSGAETKTVNDAAVYDLSGVFTDDVQINAESGTSQGVNYTYFGNGSFTVNGTATATSILRLFEDKEGFPAGMRPGGTYSVDYSTTDSNVYIRIAPYVGGVMQDPILYNTEGGSFAIPADAEGLQIRLHVRRNTTASNASVTVRLHGSYTGDYEFAERTDAEKTCLLRVIDTGTAVLADDELTLSGWSDNCRPVSWILVGVKTTTSANTPSYHLPAGYKGYLLSGNNRGAIDTEAGDEEYTIDFAETGFAPAEGTAYMVWLEYDTGVGYKQAFSNIQGAPDPDPDPGPDPDDEED